MHCSHFIKFPLPIAAVSMANKTKLAHFFIVWLLCLFKKPLLNALFSKHWTSVRRYGWAILLTCILSRKKANTQVKFLKDSMFREACSCSLKETLGVWTADLLQGPQRHWRKTCLYLFNRSPPNPNITLSNIPLSG